MMSKTWLLPHFNHFVEKRELNTFEWMARGGQGSGHYVNLETGLDVYHLYSTRVPLCKPIAKDGYF